MLGCDYPGMHCTIPQELNHQLHNCKKTENQHTSFLSPDVTKSRTNFGAREDAICSGVTHQENISLISPAGHLQISNNEPTRIPMNVVS